MKLFISLFLLPLALIFGKDISFFTPPVGWLPSQPKTLSTHVEVGFVTKGDEGFHPSINLASEEIDIPLKEYIKAVKEIHLSEPDTKWRDLGKFSMKGGLGRLTEITCPSAWGPVTLLQAILVKNDTAYILTSATLKSEFPKYQREIVKSLKSLTLSDNLFSPISNSVQRGEFMKKFSSLGAIQEEENIEDSQKKQWNDLQREVAKFGSELGAHWQYLILKDGHTKIYGSRHSDNTSK